ncbi:glycosyltransferase family 4 protein [Herbiconiux liangxiaofengii]|uniref:glycosyltransferase family 4 protein n=1 Tax=Herbiconiux liangxiaofengii TaxID=3342795 RepID=UPI0035B7F01F
MPALPRVLLDATSIPPSRGGVARFLAGLLSGLDELGAPIDVVVKAEDLDFLRHEAPGHRYHLAPRVVSRRAARLVWEQIALPRLARRLRAGVIHSPHYTFPLAAAGRCLVTVHDATFFSDPAAHSRLKGLLFRTWTRLAVRRAGDLVAVSRTTADEVLRRAGGKGRRVAVAHLGVDGSVFHPPTDSEIGDLRTAVGLRSGEEYLAFLGTIEPRKNVPALISAVRALRAADPSAPRLVLSGSRGWDAEASRLLDDPAVRQDVVEAGYLPIGSLHALLGGATVVVYPSLGEGFGLPVLEAMACASPVLTTRRLSIPEVGGDAVEYSEPDALSLERALSSLLGDRARRAELSAAARERSAEFTWTACSAVYVERYTAVAA